MNRIKIYQVDAFTSDLFTGNPAAVCPLDNWLSDEVMQSIALENNLSETAFFIKKNNKFFIRWFTPKVEIDLCGHATLAAAHVMFREMNFKDDNMEFKTITGDTLKVVKNNNILSMNFPSHEPKIINQDLEEISAALGVFPTFFLYHNYGLAVFNNEEEIIKIKPNFNTLVNLPYNGIIATAPGENVDFVSRFFGPKLGINEDPVTGGAHCELIPYWSKRLNKKDMIARQLSKRGGELYCSYLGDRVIMGGKAITYMKGELLLDIKS
tara:strand:+ start:953 stop:1753 length:801 start_codon:yes stop_codon:yes gene_type:complete